jgi:hypothetical protein
MGSRWRTYRRVSRLIFNEKIREATSLSGTMAAISFRGKKSAALKLLALCRGGLKPSESSESLFARVFK